MVRDRRVEGVRLADGSTVEAPIVVSNADHARTVAGLVDPSQWDPATVDWAENATIFGDVGFAFRLTFINKCDELERPLVAEFYQRCFGEELPETGLASASA